MLAGAAEIDITPRVGIELTGYVARLGPSVGVHDRLHARALVMDDGTARAALVACDPVGLDSAYVDRARREIGAAIGAAPGSVMVACTHTRTPARRRSFYISAARSIPSISKACARSWSR